jgi:hypothetical protein
MDFYRRYELIEPIEGLGTKSFRARQVSSARDVTVHLLVGGRTPENEQLLARLRAMPAQSFSKLIEVGDNDGTPYVVTIAPPYQALNEWLADQERAGAQNVPHVTLGGLGRPSASPEAAGPTPGPSASATLFAPRPTSGIGRPPSGTGAV